MRILGSGSLYERMVTHVGKLLKNCAAQKDHLYKSMNVFIFAT